MEDTTLTVISFNPGEVDTSMQAEIRAKGHVQPLEGIHVFCRTVRAEKAPNY